MILKPPSYTLGGFFYLYMYILKGSVGMYTQWTDDRTEQIIFARILAYVHRHYYRSTLQAQDIANDIHFSTSYMSAIFKRRMKKKLWDYITELRIESAKQLLQTTSKKRDEIAYDIGYESPEHFSRMFKRYTGISPTEYRHQLPLSESFSYIPYVLQHTSNLE